MYVMHDDVHDDVHDECDVHDAFFAQFWQVWPDTCACWSFWRSQKHTSAGAVHSITWT